MPSPRQYPKWWQLAAVFLAPTSGRVGRQGEVGRRFGRPARRVECFLDMATTLQIVVTVDTAVSATSFEDTDNRDGLAKRNGVSRENANYGLILSICPRSSA